MADLDSDRSAPSLPEVSQTQSANKQPSPVPTTLDQMQTPNTQATSNGKFMEENVEDKPKSGSDRPDQKSFAESSTSYLGLPSNLKSNDLDATAPDKLAKPLRMLAIQDPSELASERRTFRKLKKDGGSRETSPAGPFSHFAVGNDNFQTRGKVSKITGRLDISLKETGPGYIAKNLSASLQSHLHPPRVKERRVTGKDTPFGEEHPQVWPGVIKRVTTAAGFPDPSKLSVPKLNVLIMVIGSRGDIQPFLKVGKLLKEEHGHRVRIATHPAFKEFVEKDIGLEFFSVGGDPAELMAFMVKNPGLIPSVSTIRAGDIGRKRESMYEMFQGFWRACISPSDDTPTGPDVRKVAHAHPFVADAIIANPPSFAHIHCAERLGVPFHIMFTFPYTPTQQFPHPLANIKSSNIDANYTNFMSYPLVEMMTWQGLGDLINRFRVSTLGLEPVSTIWSPGQLYRLKVPHTYMWSPGLIPKPMDWGPEIDIAGFVFLDLATSFKPPEDLVKFLNAGEPPVYIGFGSIVVDNPDKFTALIFKAVAKAGVRALVSKGWGGLGDKDNTPDHIYMLENTPHDWLFPRVSAVIHHGGAGTTAIGLKCGKPTMIVPFFGDQPFWGSMVAKAGAGAKAPIPYKKLDVDALAEGIKQCLSPEAQVNAQKLAESIEAEGDGAKNAIDSFHRQLPLSGEHSMRCSILYDRVAVWALKNSVIRLSALAAEFLVAKKKVTWKDMRLLRHCDWNEYDGPGEPFTGAGQAAASSAANAFRGIASLPGRWSMSIKNERQRRKAGQMDRNALPSTSKIEGDGAQAGPGSRDTQSTSKHAEHAEEEEPEGHSIQKQDSAHLRIPLDAMNGQAPEEMSKHLSNGSPSISSQVSSENVATDLALHTQSALGEAGEAIVKAPVDISHAIAQGFHNAPRLYGDTVRPTHRISGMHSGLKAAGQELSFGIYDGVTGLVLQPYHGAKEQGIIGFFEGVCKGIGGFIIKDLAAVIAPGGYILKGIERELSKTSQPTAYIRRARMSQGALDLQRLDLRGRLSIAAKVEAAWKVLIEVRKELDAMKAKGLKGRIEMRRERKRLRREGALTDIEGVERALRERRAKAWLEKQASRMEPQEPCENRDWGNEEAAQQFGIESTGGGDWSRRPKDGKSSHRVRFGRKSVIARRKAQEDAEEAHAKWAIRQRAKAIESMGGESAARAVVDAIVAQEDSKAALKEQLHKNKLQKEESGQSSSGAKQVLDAIDDGKKGQLALDAILTKENGVPGLGLGEANEYTKSPQALQEIEELEEAKKKEVQENTDHNLGHIRKTSSMSQPPPLSTSSSTTKPSSELHTDVDTPPLNPPKSTMQPLDGTVSTSTNIYDSRREAG